MSNIKFTTNGSVTIKLKTIGNPFSNSFSYKSDIITRRPDDSGNDFQTLELNTAYTFQDSQYFELSGATSQLSKDGSNYYQFEVTGEGTVQVEGDLVSLTNNNPYVKQYQFFNLFKGCSRITSIANLNFPTSIADWCYANMFMDCTGLVDAGTILPATVTSRWCYEGMFARCTSLTTPPTILATKLAPFCYMGMFAGCTSLVEAPDLDNRKVEGDFSTNIMFKGCSNLSTIHVSFTEWPAGNWSRDWLKGVAQEGVFAKPNTLTSIPTGVVPDGWTLSSVYASKITVVDQTLSFDAMEDTTQTSAFNYSYNGEDQSLLQFTVDDQDMPEWLSWSSGTNCIEFSANGYSIDLSTSFQIPISFTASDAEQKDVTATFNILNYPSATITINTIPTIEWDFGDEEATTSSVNLLQYIQYTGADSSQLSTIVSELPEGVVYQNGVLSASKENLAENSTTTFNLSASATDARTDNYDGIQLEIVGVVPDYYKIPFTVQVYNNNTTVALKHNMNMRYSVNNGSWSDYTSNTNVLLGAGQFVSFSGNNSATSGLSLNSNDTYDVYGNINSLLNWTDNLTSGVNGTSNAFENMFIRQSKLIHASSLILPAKYINHNYPYRGMFDQCSNLCSIPQIDLLSSTGTYTCQYMFRNCPKITSAYLPLLSATATWACRNMFENCSGLQLINCNFKTWNNCNDWVKNVKSLGKFYKFSELSSAKGVNYIPTGSWSVYNKASLNVSYLNIGYSDSGDPVTIDLNNYLTNAGSNTHKFKYIPMFEQDKLPNYVTFNKNGIITYTPSSVTTSKELNSYIQIEASNGIKSVVPLLINTLDELKMTPLTFKAVEGGASVLLSAVGSPNTPSLSTSVDNGSTWSAYSVGTTINLDENQTVMFSGNSNNIGNTGYTNNYHRFKMTGKIEAKGNINSLINYSDTLSSSAYTCLFSGCASLVDVQNLVLPSKVLGSYCCWQMFSRCSSFVIPPKISAIQYNAYSCRQMFEYCSNLTGISLLGVKSSNDCFDNFVWNCTKLNYIDVNFTTWDDNAFTSWVSNVAANGTFKKPSALTNISTGANGIPNGWTVVNK